MTSTAVVKPILRVDEVLHWTENGDKDRYIKSKLKLNSNKFKNVQNAKKNLICHDMKGGYLDGESNILGCCDVEGYRFWRWWQVDIFVYFSHNFVTIPPACWIDTAHKHGVPILGTLITEWDDGAKLCAQFLENDLVMELFVKKLVEISKHYNFDGWLINVENKLEPELVKMMLKFVGILTRQLHKELPDSLVIWYDSVTIDGELLWQNELNDKNIEYFIRCDGIFLNYTWTIENLDRTMNRASLLNRLHEVYVGIDVYARSCVGRFDVCQSMEKISNRNMSVAIFAPGWTFEAIGMDDALGDNFIQNETKFWDMLNRYTSKRSLSSLPLVTSFCQGYGGGGYYWNGWKLSTTPWTNLSLQSTQPLFESGCLLCCHDDAFCGGSCLRVVCQGVTYIKLFNFDCPIGDGEDIYVQFTYKSISNVDHVDISLGFIDESMTSYHFKQNRGGYSYLILASDKADDDEDENIGYWLDNEEKDGADDVSTLPRNFWITRKLKWSNRSISKRTLTEVTLIVKPVSEEIDLELLLGYFEITTSGPKMLNYEKELFQNIFSLNLSDDDIITSTATYNDDPNYFINSLKLLSEDGNKTSKELNNLVALDTKIILKLVHESNCSNDKFTNKNEYANDNLTNKNEFKNEGAKKNTSKKDTKCPSNIYLTWEVMGDVPCVSYQVFVNNRTDWNFIAHTPTNICLCDSSVLEELIDSRVVTIKIVGVIL